MTTKRKKKKYKLKKLFSMEIHKCSVLTISTAQLHAIYKESNDFFLDLPSELCSLSLTEEKYKKALGLMVNIVEHTKNLCIKLVQQNCNANKNVCENIESGAGHIVKKLQEVNNMNKLKKI